MTISMTENAAAQIRAQLAKRGNGLGLRLGVKKVGCSGFAYTFEFADELRPDERVFEEHEAKLVVDAETLRFVEGARLDFVKEGLKQAFKLDNPNIESTCGCGASFSLKQTVKA